MASAPPLIVTTGVAAAAQDSLAEVAFHEQRERLSGTLRALSDDDWTAGSRCAQWTVHEVARHLCDTTMKATALLRGARPADVDAENMNPRTDPVSWLARSAGEDPATTLRTLDEATAALDAEVTRRLERGPADVEWVYGPIPWSVALLHVFWDAWVHERDIFLPLNREHSASPIEDRAAAVYGLVMAALPSLAMSNELDETVALTGAGGGVYRVQAAEDVIDGRQLMMVGIPAAGTVTVTVHDDADLLEDPLRGELSLVVDSLVGRDPDLEAALVGPSDRVQALGVFRAFLIAPR